MPRHILILVENLSVPFDRRVWQESRALVERRFPRDRHLPGRCRTGLRTGSGDRGRPHPALSIASCEGGPLDYLREYALALWHTLRLAIKVRREGPVDVVHACNPPDLLFLIALVLRPLGARFVFDHHDLVPELFVSRFPGKKACLTG